MLAGADGLSGPEVGVTVGVRMARAAEAGIVQVTEKACRARDGEVSRIFPDRSLVLARH